MGALPWRGRVHLPTRILPEGTLGDIEQRQHERVPGEFLVKVKIGDSPDTSEGKSLNLSRGGGMFIRSSRPAPRGTGLQVEMALDPLWKTICVEATVMWTRPKMPDPNFPSGMGVMFENLSEENQRLIDETVEALGRRRAGREGGDAPGPLG